MSNQLLFERDIECVYPLVNYLNTVYDKIPNNFTSNEVVHLSFIADLKKQGFTSKWTSKMIRDGEEFNSQEVFEHTTTKDIFIKIDYNFDENEEFKRSIIRFKHLSYSIYYFTSDIALKVINKVKSIAKKHRIVYKNMGNISLLTRKQHGGLGTTEFKIKIEDIDIELNYGKKFLKVYKRVMDSLTKEMSKGLVLFHGVPGTGKTSIIKHIAKNIQKEVIFIPPFIIDSIGSPDFVPFLINHSNSILILEDAEKVISERDTQFSSSGVSNILNISDGILGDCLNIQIIATFNTKRDNIDKALLRKGRLIAEYEFNELPVEEANKLLKHLGKGYVTDKSMTLTDIYNIDIEEMISEKKQNKIGFFNK